MKLEVGHAGYPKKGHSLLPEGSDMKFVFREAPDHLAGGMAMRCIGCVPVGLPTRRLWMGHRLPPIRGIPRGVLAFSFTCEQEE
jgi:hypothetical protein